MRAGLTISSAFHAVILGWGLIHFASPRPLEAPPVEALPIDLIDVSEMTKLRAGKRTPEKVIAPVKQAEKKAEPEPQIDPNLPVKEKTVKATPPPPEAAPPPKAQEQPKKEEPKPDVAETPAPKPVPQKEQPKKAEKQPEKKVAKVKTPPVKTKREFDPDEIAALLDRRAPSRKQNAGETKSNATLGATKGDSQQLSIDELVALARHVEKCWNVLPGVGNVERAAVELRIQMNPDGTLAAPPQVINRGTGPAFQTTAESAVRAVIACQPYKMLSANKYNFWKDMIFMFSPPETFRG